MPGLYANTMLFFFKGLEHLQILVSLADAGTHPPMDTNGQLYYVPSVFATVGIQ